MQLKRILAGLATAALVLFAAVRSDDVNESKHATTALYAGDWSPAPTARSLLGTGCTCNVQIVGGFNGTKGEPGKDGTYHPGDVLDRPIITGDVEGGAAYSNIGLRNAYVETGLRFTSASGNKRVTLAPPDAVAGADYTIKLPAAAGAVNTFLQMDTGGINTKWSGTLNAPTISGATFTGTSAFQTGSTIMGAKLDGATTIAAGAVLTGVQLAGTTTFQAGSTITGATLTGAQLTGTTAFQAGSTITGATLTGAKLAGTTTFQAGSTITGAKLDGSTTIAAGAVLTGAQLAGETTFASGATLVNAQLAGTTTFAPGITLNAPVSSGQTLVKEAVLASSIPPQLCSGTVDASSLLTMTGATPCALSPRYVGSVLHWEDAVGTTSVVTQYLSPTTARISAVDGSADAPPVVTRLAPTPFKLFYATRSFSASRIHANMPVPLVHDSAASASVKLSLAPMLSQSLATWSFPRISDTNLAPSDTLVGASAPQTLLNKKLTSPALTGIITTDALSAFKNARFRRSVEIETESGIWFADSARLTLPGLISNFLNQFYVRTFTTAWNGMPNSVNMILTRIGCTITLAIPYHAATPNAVVPISSSASLIEQEWPLSDATFAMAIGTVFQGIGPEKVTIAKLTVSKTNGRLYFEHTPVAGDSMTRITGGVIQWLVQNDPIRAD